MISIQSNALRDDFMHDIVDRTIVDIHDDLTTVFGPYASEAFLTKNGHSYYTRDGLEVLESLRYSNTLSEYIKNIIYQASYDQGKHAGDGTTTLAILYTNLYLRIREISDYLQPYGMTTIRSYWGDLIKNIKSDLDEMKCDMTDEHLRSVLLTCTQDEDLSAKIYSTLKDAILSGAHIVVNKSNMEQDFAVTTYRNPLIKARREFTVRPINTVEKNTVLFHCNGMLDIAHVEVLNGLFALELNDGTQSMHPNIVIVCNGTTDRTRRTLKEFVRSIHDNKLDVNQYNNIAVYTLVDYRAMDEKELEDISTIITDEKGIGGLVNALTFESYLYQAFQMNSVESQQVPDLETYDCDMRHIDHLRNMLVRPREVQFDDQEGIRIMTPLGPVAQQRYEDLKHEYDVEKSDVAKYRLNKRLKTIYGQFIEVEVGAALVKESQRKYELILDAIVSTMEGVESGVLKGCSILHLYQALSHYDIYNYNCTVVMDMLAHALKRAVLDTFIDMVDKMYQIDTDTVKQQQDATDITVYPEITVGEDYVDQIINSLRPRDIEQFKLFDDMRSLEDALKPYHINHIYNINVHVENPDGEESVVEIADAIVEPLSIMQHILDNSMTAIELALARTFHVNGFETMGNYI